MRNSLLLCILGFPLLLGSAGCNSSSGNVNLVQFTISTGALPNGTVGAAYGPAVLNASGGMTPYTWSWAAQAGSSLPPGLSIKSNNDNTGTISGTPTTAESFNVTVTATGADAGAAHANFTIVIAAPATTCTPSGTTLCGQFTFLAQGAKGNSESPVMIAGTFFADGNGNVITGLFDRNNGSVSGSGSFFNKLITGGNFNVGTDGRGSVTLSTISIAGPFSITFTFALNATGTFAFLFESDDQNGAGNHVSGFMKAADSSKFNAASITGGYAMGLLGGTSAASRPRALLIAAVSATGSDCGLSSNGNSVFINYNAGTVTPSPIPFACGSGGLSSIDATMGRGTVSIVLSNGPFSSQTLNFAFYIVDKTTIILISTDSVGANLPILSGTMALQIPIAVSGFTQVDLACGRGELGNVKACIFGVSGESGSGSHIVVGRAKGSLQEVLDITADENKAGVVSSQATRWSVVISPSGAGTLTPTASQQSIPAAFVLVSHDQAILALADGSVSFGFIRAQVELAPSATPGTFIAGTQSVANGSVPNLSGIITPTGPTNGNGTFTGTLDAEQILAPPPAPVEISGAAITGNYTLDSPATGRGTGGSTQPGPSSFIIYNVNVNEIVLMESDATSPQPMLIDLIQSGSPWDY
jgi:large repetitive protein